MNIGYIEALLAAAVLALPVAAYARHKGRSPVDFYLAAFLFLLPVAVYAMWMKPKYPIEPGTVVRLRGRTTFKDGTKLPKRRQGTVLAVEDLNGTEVVFVEFDDVASVSGYQGWLPRRGLEAVDTIDGLTLADRVFYRAPQRRLADG